MRLECCPWWSVASAVFFFVEPRCLVLLAACATAAPRTGGPRRHALAPVEGIVVNATVDISCVRCEGRRTRGGCEALEWQARKGGMRLGYIHVTR